jgi:aconitate hydratase
MPVPEVAGSYKKAGYGSVIVADENYGEGSSREHAAMEPRFMGVRAVIARSFARIHETNLKKQGILALTFSDKSDYDKILEDDTIDIKGVNEFSPGQPLTIVLHHADGTKDEIKANHTYNENQIEWFKSGSALNMIRKMNQ